MARKSKEFRQLFNQDSVQKRSPSTLTSRRQREKATLESFKQELENDPDYEDSVLIESPKNVKKLSEVLIEYIEPFLEDTETSQDRSNLVDIAVMAWNLALVSKEERQELLKDLFSDSPDLEKIEIQKAFQRLMNQLIKRKLKLFAKDKRFIKEFKFTENGGHIHIAVATM